jgi:hypothetical protein
VPASGVERDEFMEACGRLEQAGYRLRELDGAWEAFSGLRAKYAIWLNMTVRNLAVPPAPWIGDRSYLPHRERGVRARGPRRLRRPSRKEAVAPPRNP